MIRPSTPLVAHVIYALKTGGLENGIVNIINRSPMDRYRHVIICITDADKFGERITAKGVELIEMNKQPGHDLGFYWRLWKVFRTLRPAIIHSRNIAALETLIFSCGINGVKRVHGEHGRDANDLDGTYWKYLYFRKFMRVFVDRYISVSKDLERWLVEQVRVPPAKICQIYNGVDYERFCVRETELSLELPEDWPDRPEGIIVGTVGRLTQVKDQQSLLLAVAELRKSRPDLTRRLGLMIVGDGPLRQKLSAMARDLGLDSITWLPGDRDDIPYLLAAMDIFVLPSLAEGISNTLLEAMACSLPVVATNVGGNVELIEQGCNGSLFPVADTSALAQCLADLMDSPNERHRMGKNGREKVRQEFDWNRTVNEYMDVYDSLLNLKVGQGVTDVG